uniref:Localization factor PodJL n=1 Tax=Panagrellus redivivus TaxID=6233 RepID=A0A7E4ZRP4_PANRE
MVRQSGNPSQQRRQNGVAGAGTGSNSLRGQMRPVQAESNGSQRGGGATPAPIPGKPRQMIRVQRSEPRDGFIRNELRFVSYGEKRNLGNAPVEARVVGEAFSALINRFRELNIELPGLNPNELANTRESSEIALLKDKLSSSEAEVERLRQVIADLRKPDSTTGHEPEWVRIIESQLRAVSDQLNPLHTQAQRFSPQIADLKAHMRHILDEIHENRVAGKLTDDRVRQDIHAKLEQCRHIAADTVNPKRR